MGEEADEKAYPDRRVRRAVCGGGLGVRLAAQLGEVHAKSAILMTDTGQVLFEHNADAVHPPASVTKLMTMLLTIEAVDGEAHALNDRVTASAHAAEMGGLHRFISRKASA